MLLLAGEAPAQTHDVLADIRADYAKVSADWLPLPLLVQEAFIAAEDKAFRSRYPKTSTLTREISAWYPEPGLGRIGRMFVTHALSKSLTEDEVLAWYLHGIFLGRGCFGVEAAAMAWFGHPVSALTPAEAAALAALVKAPQPISADPDLHLKRRNYVLDEMLASGALDAEQAEAAKAEKLVLADKQSRCDG